MATTDLPEQDIPENQTCDHGRNLAQECTACEDGQVTGYRTGYHACSTCQVPYADCRATRGHCCTGCAHRFWARSN